MACQGIRDLRLERLEPRQLLSAVPVLHSYPGAAHTIFLDFDGHVLTGTLWNADFLDRPIHLPAFDADGQRYDEQGRLAFSAEEREIVASIWARVAEDFRPFDVDVTTEDPSLLDPGIFARPGEALRVLFTSRLDNGPGGTGDTWFHRSSFGFAQESWDKDFDNPAFVFSSHPVGAGEIASHEIGHALGLHHDGLLHADGSVVEYYGGHGSGETHWSPIMGTGNVLTQWSDGGYPGATQLQDDISVLTQRLGVRPDDYVGPAELNRVGTWVDTTGIIGRSSDSDLFTFQVTVQSHATLDILPWHTGPNLDIAASLLGPAGTLVPSSDPQANPPDRLAARIDRRLTPGTYYLLIDGTGKLPTDGDPGYSTYGSLGQYHIQGAIAPLGDLDHNGTVTAADINILQRVVSGNYPPAAGQDLNQDGVVTRPDVDMLVRQVIGTQYGDLNLDRRVDFADFQVLARHFGQPAAASEAGPGWARGDLDGDGDVDFADLVHLSNHFGFAGTVHSRVYSLP